MAILDPDKFQVISGGTESVVDVVIVHGLNGTPTTCWTTFLEPELIRSRVAQPFNNVRFFTFGYSSSISTKCDSDFVTDQAEALLDDLDLGKLRNVTESCDKDLFDRHMDDWGPLKIRPLIFVGVDLGVLIIKKALLTANHRRSYVAQRTQGILFLGTFNCGDSEREKFCAESRYQKGPPRIGTDTLSAFHYLESRYAIISLCEDSASDCLGLALTDECGWQRLVETKSQHIFNDHFRVQNLISSSEVHEYVAHSIIRLVKVASAVDLTLGCWKRTQSLRSSYNERRLPGSYKWIQGSSEYITWAQSEPIRPLWITGSPGSGKSFLASALLDELSAEGHNICYFFQDFQREEPDSSKNILQCLAHQLVEITNMLFSSFPGRMLRHRAADYDAWSDMKSIVSDFHHSHRNRGKRPSIMLMIDGLDSLSQEECSVVLKELHSFYKLSSPVFEMHYILTSRHPCHDKDKFIVMSLDADKRIRREICKYAEHELNRSHSTYTSNSQLLSKLSESICNHAQGTFLWASLSLEVLRRCPVQQQLKAVSSLPSNVFDLYRRILMDRPVQCGDFIQVVFAWLTTTRRPLNLLEIFQILELEFTSDVLSNDASLKAFSREIPEICRGILFVSRNGTLNFTHSSSYEFLRSLATMKTGTDTSAQESLPLAHETVARGCMAFLEEQTGAQCKKQSDYVLNFSEVTTYASENWSFHLRKATLTHQPIPGMLQNSLGKICDQLLCDHEDWLSQNPEQVTQHYLNIGAFHGITPLIKMALEMGATSSERLCPHCPSPLALAAAEGHSEAVRILLKFGANMSPSELTGRNSALFYAAVRQKVDIVELLLDAGASADDCLDDNGNTALHLAAASSQESLIRLLLKYGADITKRNTAFRENVLHVAAANGSMRTVAILLKYRKALSWTANVPKRSKSPTERAYWKTVLPVGHGKIDTSHNKIKKYRPAKSPSRVDLAAYDKGYEYLNTRNAHDQTALSIAASNGHLEVLQCLLEDGADVNLKDCDGRTAMYQACAFGHKTIVAFLLQYEVPLNESLQSLLKVASANGHRLVEAQLSPLLTPRLSTPEEDDFVFVPRHKGRQATDCGLFASAMLSGKS